jgi:hypothetical protein
MKSTLPDEALNQIFREARTHSAWLENPVSDEILRQLYDLMKWGPTRWMRNFSARAKNAKAVNRSFFPRATSGRISYATLAMAMSRNSSQEDHGWHLTRPARFYERDAYPF